MALNGDTSHMKGVNAEWSRESGREKGGGFYFDHSNEFRAVGQEELGVFKCPFPLTSSYDSEDFMIYLRNFVDIPTSKIYAI